MGKRSREVRDADAPYRASYGRPGAGCRTLVIPPFSTYYAKNCGRASGESHFGYRVIDRENTDFPTPYVL